ncbi:hypothetical protein AYL99_11895 [Fonsecaea erecta]|uniref:Cyclohexanone monooxygenase n=1 Tax=Fonsecaea erecta TaxID=1367422 RepID=A0A178Z3U8_9EURO|nr:hypothetical protein AYL99_11895 [Fonsecaea erecta]OAP53873.1 hypothetical protein AYL99_11895 [Fonsecaea erecta]
MPSVVSVDVLVVGAGLSGLWALHQLRTRGFECLCVDACDDVGGVWHYTRYPGCRNDTEHSVYQLPLEGVWAWKERFPERQEIAAYARRVCEVLGLRQHIVFNTRVNRALWDETNQHWVTYVQGEGTDEIFVTARFFLPCTGYTGQKFVPGIKGLETFQQAFHTSEWPEHLDTRGKRVGIIGTGSSGVQIIETLGPQVSQLTVFQRTPNYAMPRHPDRAGLSVVTGLWRPQVSSFGSRVARPSTMRQSSGDSTSKSFGKKAARTSAYAFWRDKTRSRITDIQKREVLAPMSPPYSFGTKRPSLETNYFEIFNQSNVDLVDLNRNDITRVTPTGIYTAPHRFYALDVIVLATGYDFGIGSQLAIDIRGRNGLSLREKWGVSDKANKMTLPESKGVMSYLGMTCAGFPNMVLVCGPQSPTAFAVAPRFAELQINWISTFLTHVCHNGGSFDTCEEAERKWKGQVARVAQKTLFAGTKTWYMINKPDRPDEALFWLGGMTAYFALCRALADRGYPGFIVNTGAQEL